MQKNRTTSVCLISKISNPAGTRRQDNVVNTSFQRFDFVTTSIESRSNVMCQLGICESDGRNREIKLPCDQIFFYFFKQSKSSSYKINSVKSLLILTLSLAKLNSPNNFSLKFSMIIRLAEKSSILFFLGSIFIVNMCSLTISFQLYDALMAKTNAKIRRNIQMENICRQVTTICRSYEEENTDFDDLTSRSVKRTVKKWKSRKLTY